MNSLPFLRHLLGKVEISLRDTPAVLINGPRQSGKTTLAKQLSSSQSIPYVTLDDPVTLASIRFDPQAFVQRADRVIIDEIQRAPELLLAIKRSIDEDRRPGRFLLTGSANVMTLPTVGDSLAGRIELHTLLPLSNAEINRRPSDFLSRALNQNWPACHSSNLNLLDAQNQFEAQVLGGGYPEMLDRPTFSRKQAWARSYIKMLVERDVQDIAKVDQSSQIPRLLSIAAQYSGQLTNFSHVGGQIGFSEKTVAKYIDILERVYLVKRIPAWSRNELKRLTKTAKLHFLDAGLQAVQARVTLDSILANRTAFGQTLECWAFAELQKNIDASSDEWHLSHFRDNQGHEVDFVLEAPTGEIIGIEVKASTSIQYEDFRGLRKLKTLSDGQMITGIVLYSGQQALSFNDGFWAVPISYL